MGKATGFMEFDRHLPRRRPVKVRLRDWREVYEPQVDEAVQVQGARVRGFSVRHGGHAGM